MPRKIERNQRISTCVSAAELKTIRAAAERAGLPVSIYMRVAALAAAAEQKPN